MKFSTSFLCIIVFILFQLVYDKFMIGEFVFVVAFCIVMVVVVTLHGGRGIACRG